MKIVRHPYHARIVPQAEKLDSLWHCEVRVDGSAEVLMEHEACSKEDACCAVLLELARLQRQGKVSAPRRPTPRTA